MSENNLSLKSLTMMSVWVGTEVYACELPSVVGVTPDIEAKSLIDSQQTSYDR